MINWLAGTKYGRWLLGAAALATVIGALLLRAWFGGKAAAKAEATAQVLKRALEGAHAREQEKRNPTDPMHDEYNRDRGGPR